MDAVDQFVTYSFKGGEFAFRVAGAAAKNLVALLAALAKDSYKTRGATRLSRFSRDGIDQSIITIAKENMKDFCKDAERYGILYCVVHSKNDQECDIIVRSSDAAKVNRIFQKYGWGTPDVTATIDQIDPKSIPANSEITNITANMPSISEQELDDLWRTSDSLAELEGTITMKQEMLREAEAAPQRFSDEQIESIRQDIEATKQKLVEQHGIQPEDIAQARKDIESQISSRIPEGTKKNPTKGPDRSDTGRPTSRVDDRTSVRAAIKDASARAKEKAPKTSRTRERPAKSKGK